MFVGGRTLRGERPLWSVMRYDRLWPVAGIDAIRLSGR